MLRPTRATKWTAAASLAVASMVTVGMTAANGSSVPAPAHGPDPLNGGGCSQSFSGTWGAVKADPGVNVSHCVDNTRPMPMWAPPKGAIRTVAGWIFNGHPLTAAEGDVLRTTDGRMRLFIPDVGQIETGKPSVAITKDPVVDGMIEVTPAPLSINPPRPGDNSAGL
jgi:hypothetical protein